MHLCVCVRAREGKVLALLRVRSKLHMLTKVGRIPLAIPTTFKKHPHGGASAAKAGESSGEPCSFQSPSSSVIPDCPLTHQIFIQHLPCSRHCARHGEYRVTKNSVPGLGEAHSLVQPDMSKQSEKCVFTVHSGKHEDRELYSTVECITRGDLT